MATPEAAISVRSVGKMYRIYERPQDRLKLMFFRRFGRVYGREFWALRDVSFELGKGDALGIVGRNGSGKSTLLQIIAGTLAPSEGQVELNGRVAALLELASGFNPEFTGRENVFLNASIMGLNRKETEARFPEIIDFADIGDFIEQPVKTYSSGMMLRLAFAVQTTLEPEILIVDEALTVGDVFFQAKCMLKLSAMLERGLTLLFVSHDMGAVQALCSRAVLLEHGTVKLIGDTKTVGAMYWSQHHADQNVLLAGHKKAEQAYDHSPLTISRPLPGVEFEDGGEEFERQVVRHGDGRKWIYNVKVLDIQGRQTSEVDYRGDFLVRVYIEAQDNLEDYCVGIRLQDDKGLPLAASSNVVDRKQAPKLRKGTRYIFDHSVRNVLAAGVYSVNTGIESIVHSNQQHFTHDAVHGSAMFRIKNPSDPALRFWARTYIPAEIKVFEVSSSSAALDV
jgi:homopolymeric O-antigen transport system ATP-binding protein